MRRIRALVVDDSVVIRRVISDVLGEDRDIEVVGVAANGRIALAKIEQLRPDIVLLDLDMPVMDGLTTLIRIRETDRQIPVLMFSAFTERGAEATLEALFRGATDYVTKPSNMGSAESAQEAVRQQLIPKIKALTLQRRPAGERLERPRAEVGRPAFRLSHGRIRAVVIAASTGGPNALQHVLGRLPEGFRAPILVVQHMPEIFTTFLAHQLSAKTQIRVKEGEHGERVRPGVAYIAPGGQHMAVETVDEGVRIVLNREAPENSCRPSADVLFRAAVRAWGADVLAVVLTGMGKDGLRGCEVIRESGGQVVAQDQASSVVWGMPGFVAGAGLADVVVGIDRVGEEIIERVARYRDRAIR